VVGPIRTFLDSGVLIAAFKGAPQLREVALQVLEDPHRVFVTSPFVRLEVLLKAIFNKQANERRFYEHFFARAEFASDLMAIFDLGEKEAAKTGVGSMDSLHLAAAHLMNADEFLTTEEANTEGAKKSIHRSRLVKVVCVVVERQRSASQRGGGGTSPGIPEMNDILTPDLSVAPHGRLGALGRRVALQ